MDMLVTEAVSQSGHDRPNGRRSLFLRRLYRSFALLILVPLLFACWAYRETLLELTAQAWIVSDPVEPADAVMVLGGGLETRPFAAASYYRSGLVPKVLVSGAPITPSQALGALPPHTAANRALLMRLGVPEQAIEIIGRDLSNTFEESIALRHWAEHNRA